MRAEHKALSYTLNFNMEHVHVRARTNEFGMSGISKTYMINIFLTFYPISWVLSSEMPPVGSVFVCSLVPELSMQIPKYHETLFECQRCDIAIIF